MFDKLVECLESEHFASCGEYHLFHVFTTNAETSSAYAGDNLIFWIVGRTTGKAQLSEVLNPSYLIPGHLR